MMPVRFPASQRGVVTIVISMIMLLLVTLLVVAAYSLSTLNLRAVGNMQTREEATAAAEKLIEKTIDGTFWSPAIEQTDNFNVGGADYHVVVAAPVCLRATEANITTTSSVTLPGFSSAVAWNTVWLLDATAASVATGTRVRVRQGVRVLMSDTDKDTYCGV